MNRSLELAMMSAAIMAASAADYFSLPRVARVDYEPPKMTGFTDAKGKKKLSKKKRKQLKQLKCKSS